MFSGSGIVFSAATLKEELSSCLSAFHPTLHPLSFFSVCATVFSDHTSARVQNEDPKHVFLSVRAQSPVPAKVKIGNISSTCLFTITSIPPGLLSFYSDDCLPVSFFTLVVGIRPLSFVPFVTAFRPVLLSRHEPDDIFETISRSTLFHASKGRNVHMNALFTANRETSSSDCRKQDTSQYWKHEWCKTQSGRKKPPQHGHTPQARPPKNMTHDTTLHQSSF